MVRFGLGGGHFGRSSESCQASFKPRLQSLGGTHDQPTVCKQATIPAECKECKNANLISYRAKEASSVSIGVATGRAEVVLCSEDVSSNTRAAPANRFASSCPAVGAQHAAVAYLLVGVHQPGRRRRPAGTDAAYNLLSRYGAFEAVSYLGERLEKLGGCAVIPTRLNEELAHALSRERWAVQSMCPNFSPIKHRARLPRQRTQRVQNESQSLLEGHVVLILGLPRVGDEVVQHLRKSARSRPPPLLPW